MIKSIKLESGEEIKLASSAAFLYIYQNQFREDPFKKLFPMIKDISAFNENRTEETSDLDLMDRLDMLFLTNLTWAMAKNANASIPDPIEFYQKYPDFLPLEHIDQVIDLATGSMVSTQKAKN